MDTPSKQPQDSENQPLIVSEQKAEYATHGGFGEQDENGVDISLLRENLKLTPTQRLEKMLNAARFIQDLKNARDTK